MIKKNSLSNIDVLEKPSNTAQSNPQSSQDTRSSAESSLNSISIQSQQRQIGGIRANKVNKNSQLKQQQRQNKQNEKQVIPNCEQINNSRIKDQPQVVNRHSMEYEVNDQAIVLNQQNIRNNQNSQCLPTSVSSNSSQGQQITSTQQRSSAGSNSLTGQVVISDKGNSSSSGQVESLPSSGDSSNQNPSQILSQYHPQQVNPSIQPSNRLFSQRIEILHDHHSNEQLLQQQLLLNEISQLKQIVLSFPEIVKSLQERLKKSEEEKDEKQQQLKQYKQLISQLVNLTSKNTANNEINLNIIPQPNNDEQASNAQQFNRELETQQPNQNQHLYPEQTIYGHQQQLTQPELQQANRSQIHRSMIVSECGDPLPNNVSNQNQQLNSPSFIKIYQQDINSHDNAGQSQNPLIAENPDHSHEKIDIKNILTKNNTTKHANNPHLHENQADQRTLYMCETMLGTQLIKERIIPDQKPNETKLGCFSRLFSRKR